MTDLFRRWGRRALVAATAAGLATAPTPADATQPRAQDRNATDGVDRVYHDYSAEGDASSLELNPALLSSMRGLDITLLGYRTVSEFARGSGFGGWFGWGLPFGLATSFGVQVMAPRLGLEIADFDAAANPAATKISWGISAAAGDTTAIGFGIHGLRVGGQWLQRPDLDVGTLFRIFNYGSIGVAARFSPVELSTDIFPAHMSLTGEVSIRPLGTHHVELAGGVTQRVASGGIGDPVESNGVSALFPRGRIALRHQGLALKGEVEQVSASVLDPVSFDRLRGEKAWRGSVSLEAAWDFLRVGGGVHAGLSEGLDGVGVMARFSTRRQGRVFWPRRVDAERIDLSSLQDERDLIGMLQRLERARKAGKRAILVVDARGTGLGWASVHEVREALVRVRNAGGHVFAYVENAGLKDYFLATAAEKIYIHPAGGLSIYGMSSTSIYLRGALDKLGVKAEVIKVDEYKSAGERFTNVEPSKYDRDQRTELMADMYTQVVYDTARARGRSLSDMRAFFDEAPYEPEQAVELGLADGVVFRDELLPEISEIIGAEVEIKEFSDTSPHETWATAPYVAVVLVEDAIVDGKSRRIPFVGTGFAGGDTIAETLRDLRDDKACRGVVLRVNSPGGSALASDIIWREVQRTAEAHEADPKFAPPIVVSMGDVAASGGYYVSMGAPFVLADPMTITGSIGVISMHFDVSGLLGKLGISTTTFKAGKNADIGSPWSSYTEDQRDRIERSIRQTYGLFTSRVADGRGMTQEKVNELGRGHVWSGVDAKANGLVDGLGGLHEAIAEVRRRADIPKRKKLAVRVLPKEPRLLDLILNDSSEPFGDSGPVRAAVAKRRKAKERSALGEVLPLALNAAISKIPLSMLLLPQGKPAAIMPYVIDTN